MVLYTCCCCCVGVWCGWWASASVCACMCVCARVWCGWRVLAIVRARVWCGWWVSASAWASVRARVWCGLWVLVSALQPRGKLYTPEMCENMPSPSSRGVFFHNGGPAGHICLCAQVSRGACTPRLASVKYLNINTAYTNLFFTYLL